MNPAPEQLNPRPVADAANEADRAPTTLSLRAELVDVLGMGDTAAQRRGLRQMKLRAGLLLVPVAGLWFASYLVAPHSSGVQFLRAAAEAGMVGGLADWFAVTALFRHPLRLPIPHTALIPRKKDELANTLGTFVAENFLTPEAVRKQVRSAGLVRAAATFASDPGKCKALATQLVDLAAFGIRSLSPDAVASLTTRVLRNFVKGHSIAAPLGQLIDNSVASGAHRPLVDQLLRSGLVVLKEHRSQLVQAVEDLAGRTNRFVGWFVSGAPANHAVDWFEEILAEAVAHPHHWLRQQLDTWLKSFAADLSNGGESARNMDTALRSLVDEEMTQAWIGGLTQQLLSSAEKALADPDGGASQDAANLIQSVAERLLADESMLDSVEGHLEDTVVALVQAHGHRFSQVIQSEVKRWTPEETAERFEVAVGRDLQYIRINGTIVGALAGVAIHTVSLLLA